MDLELNGKRVLVLASSQGLGLGIASSLVNEGAHVCLSGRSKDKLKARAEDLTNSGPGKADYIISDLSAPAAAKDLYKAAIVKMGGVDILVNNTGGPPPGETTAHAADLWRSQFDTMVARVIEIADLCLPSDEGKRLGTHSNHHLVGRHSADSEPGHVQHAEIRSGRMVKISGG